MTDTLPQVTHTYQNHTLDSPRWHHYTPRDDDVVVATSLKSGTTWMQVILAHLILGVQSTPNIDCGIVGGRHTQKQDDLGTKSSYRRKRGIMMKLSWLVLVLFLSWMGTALAQPETVIAVELTGGAHAGGHELSTDISACLYGSGNGDDWRTLYGSEDSGPGALSTVLLLIPETTPAESGSSDFFFSAGLGEYGTDDYVEYILDPPNGNGTGTVTIQWDGRKRAVLNVVGQTAEGLGVSATVTCANVLRVGGEALAVGELGRLDFGTGLPAGAAATGSLELTIGDKSHSLMTNAEIADCAPDSFETGDFFYSYYPPGVTSLELYAPSLEEALQGTETFGLGFDLQPIYRPGEGGSGSLTATLDGQQLTLVADVTTADGTPIRATIHCPLPN